MDRTISIDFKPHLMKMNQPAAKEPAAEQVQVQPAEQTPETWQSRIKAGTATDDDIKTAAEEAKAGRYIPGPKTQKAIDALQPKPAEAETVEPEIAEPEAVEAEPAELELTADEGWSDGPEYNRGPEAEQISEEIQNEAFDENGNPNPETKEKVDNAVEHYLGVTKNEDGSFDVQSFKAPSFWESQDKLGKASIILTAVSALATALSFGRIPPINFMALTGAQEKWMLESKTALDNYNSIVGAQAQSMGEAEAKNKYERTRSEQNIDTTQKAADVDAIKETASEAKLKKLDKDLTESLKKVDRETQETILNIQAQYAQDLERLKAELQIAVDNNNTARQKQIMNEAAQLQNTATTKQLESLSESVKAGRIDQKAASKAMNALKGNSAAQQGLNTLNTGIDAFTKFSDSQTRRVQGMADALGVILPVIPGM